MGMGHLRRLEHIRTLLRAREGVEAADTRLFCFSGGGFTDELLACADGDAAVQLIDLDRLYNGA
ncbi:hypothetical protein [Streptomyces sp. NBC_01803]|uniref:hypothetical protein n=1 Tax=Streptomyces sp. NBC_01803 TaxID=2975946 RepID=UPI002DD8AB67|nr:hypothetical protein [Streptomyces sp. NBC_01803]WSA43221.1 hypothetical protein OIE51_02840 [Streptomyces sp. NBC_01803]